METTATTAKTTRGIPTTVEATSITMGPERGDLGGNLPTGRPGNGDLALMPTRRCQSRRSRLTAVSETGGLEVRNLQVDGLLEILPLAISRVPLQDPRLFFWSRSAIADEKEVLTN